jgi:YHS domain-containing protein
MGPLIAWIGRVLLILFVVRLIVSLFRSGASRSTGASPNAGGARPSNRGGRKEKIGAKLVRDPQCGTYVSETSAIRASRHGETLHFCSERCRDQYLQSSRANAS